MHPNMHGIPAAPNESKIEALVLGIDQSLDFADKWLLLLEILKSESISGPNFAREGETVQSFTFNNITGISEGSIISAHAEYLGDARTGQFQLTQVQRLD